MADQQTQSNAQQQVKDTAQNVAQQARDKSTDVVQKTQDTARQVAHEQKGKAAGSISELADALRQTGHTLQDNNQDMFGRYAMQAADQLDRFSDDLQNKNVDDIMNDVQDFARREPQLFLGGAFVLGLFAARFLKSSTPRPNQDYSRYGQGQYYNRGQYYGQGQYQGQGQYSGQGQYYRPEKDFETTEGLTGDYTPEPGTGEYRRSYSTRYGETGSTQPGQSTSTGYTVSRGTTGSESFDPNEDRPTGADQFGGTSE